MDKKDLYEQISIKILDDMVKQFGDKEFKHACIDICSLCILTTISTHVKREYWNEAMIDVAESLIYNMEKCTSLMPGGKENG